MEQLNDPFKKVIFSHLQELAGKDELFAKTLSKENKNIDDCATYILNTVKTSKRQGFADDEIFNMAIHYYYEDDIEVGNKISARVVVNHPLAAPIATSGNLTTKPTAKSINANQTSLFL